MATKLDPSLSHMQVQEQGLGLGLRRIQASVPDVWSASFRSEARRQSLAVAKSSHASDDQAFIDSVSIFAGDE